ncbi:MAG: F0F1 ATP synthase subunit gamma, partial [bacterium]
MKMVSSARLRRAEERVRNARPYVEHMERIFSLIASAVAGDVLHQLAEVRPAVLRTGFLVLSSDRGLCGSYNTNLLRAVESHAAGVHGEKVIYAAGRTARDYFRRRKWNIAREFVNISFHLEYREIKNIVDAAAGDFLAG